MTASHVPGTMHRGTDAPSPQRRSLAWPRPLLAALCFALALIFLAEAGWVHAKALLAQALLERAWQRSDTEGKTPPPWPWADTRPVARLHAPPLRRSQIVLAGDSGRVLAFGPGWAPASAAPEQSGLTVISGHRDTHFAWLQHLRRGDRVRLETTAGEREYVVTDLRVADASQQHIALDDGDADALLLVTCWPFDAVAGGSQRYLVSARPLAP